MSELLQAVELWPLSTYIREASSIWGYGMWLTVHVMAMGVLAGSATVMSFALLGMWPKGAPVRPLAQLFPYMRGALVVIVITGVGLFMADAFIRFYNWDLWLKLGFVAGAVFLTSRARRTVFTDERLDNGGVPGANRLAWGMLICWFGAILGGRLIAYVGPVAGLFF